MSDEYIKIVTIITHNKKGLFVTENEVVDKSKRLTKEFKEYLKRRMCTGISRI